MRKEFERAGLFGKTDDSSATVFGKVNWFNATDAEADFKKHKYFKYYNSELSVGEVAQFDSHQRLWAYIEKVLYVSESNTTMSQRSDAVLIIEDDVIFPPNFSQLFGERAAQLPPSSEYDIAFVGGHSLIHGLTNGTTSKVSTLSSSESGGSVLLKNIRKTRGAWAYILTRRGAQKLLSFRVSGMISRELDFKLSNRLNNLTAFAFSTPKDFFNFDSENCPMYAPPEHGPKEINSDYYYGIIYADYLKSLNKDWRAKQRETMAFGSFKEYNGLQDKALTAFNNKNYEKSFEAYLNLARYYPQASSLNGFVRSALLYISEKPMNSTDRMKILGYAKFAIRLGKDFGHEKMDMKSINNFNFLEDILIKGLEDMLPNKLDRNIQEECIFVKEKRLPINTSSVCPWGTVDHDMNPSTPCQKCKNTRPLTEYEKRILNNL
eukprot:g2756.t1